MITCWSQLPLIVTWEHVGDLLGVASYDAVKHAIQAGHVPPPFATHPMRWSRAELQRHFGDVRVSA